ncbi:MAG: phosphate ABC transporter substrate-binding protein [Proteobacteria bacterium]|nr:phosphate ABC transporter substrate-binding protein [Pseudomonadota bacterium]
MKSLSCYCLILLLTSFAASADVVVVVSAKSTVTHLTAEQAARIFLGKSNTFPDGGNVVPVDQPEGAAIRDEFYARVASKNASQLTAYWARVIFTGGDSCPPKLLEGNAAVRRAVAGNPNAIGYIDRNALDGSVRVVLDP